MKSCLLSFSDCFFFECCCRSSLRPNGCAHIASCSAEPGSSILADALSHVPVDVGFLHPAAQRGAFPLPRLPAGLPEWRGRPLLSTGASPRRDPTPDPQCLAWTGISVSCRSATTSCSRGTDWSTTQSRPTGWLSARWWRSPCSRCLAPSPSSEVGNTLPSRAPAVWSGAFCLCLLLQTRHDNRIIKFKKQRKASKRRKQERGNRTVQNKEYLSSLKGYYCKARLNLWYQKLK